MWLCVHLCKCVCACTCACVCTCVYMYVCVQVFVYACVLVCVFVCVCCHASKSSFTVHLINNHHKSLVDLGVYLVWHRLLQIPEEVGHD